MECCTPVLLVSFRFRPPGVYERHTGIGCAGQLDELDFELWYRTGERRFRWEG